MFYRLIPAKKKDEYLLYLPAGTCYPECIPDPEMSEEIHEPPTT